MKQLKKIFFKKISTVLQICFLLVAPLQNPIIAATPEKRVTYYVDEALLKLSEQELIETAKNVYAQAESRDIERSLPEPFLLCYALLCDKPEQIKKEDLAIALQSIIDWSSEQLKGMGKHRARGLVDERVPRPNATNQPVGPGGCCNLDEVLALLALINEKLGSGIDVDLSSIEQCCSNLTAEVIQDFNETWTILALLSTPTIVLNVDLSPVFTVLNILTANECSPVLIKQTDVNTTTFTISQPNRYIFSQDITFNPASGQPAIAITSNDVSLDLLCHTLSQGNATANVDAVNVVSNLSNVTVTHGTIKNFTRTGISVGSGCSDVTVDGVTTFSCNKRGIEFVGSSGTGRISESTIANCELMYCCRGVSGDNVLTLSHCVDLRVKNCLLHDNGVFQHTLDVAHLTTCTNCQLINLTMNDNVASLTVNAFNLVDSHQCRIKKCTTNNTYSSQSDAHGIKIDGMNNTVEGCKIQNTFSTASSAESYSNVVTGISLLATSSGNIIVDNTITNSVALSTSSSAMSIYGLQMLETETLNTTGLSFTLTASFATTARYLAWSPNGRFLAVIDGGGVRVFEFTNNRLIHLTTATHGAFLRAVAWSPDGSNIAIGGETSAGVNVRVFQFNNSGLTAVTTTSVGTAVTVFDLEWSSDGRFIVVGTTDTATRSVSVLEFGGSSLTEVATFAHGDTVRTVSFSSDQRYITMGGVPSAGVAVRVLDFSLTAVVPTVLSSLANFSVGSNVSGVDFSPSTEFIAISILAASPSMKVLRFNGSSLTEIASFDHGNVLTSVQWSPCAKLILTTGAVGTGSFNVHLMRFQNNTISTITSLVLGTASTFYGAWSPDGAYVAFFVNPSLVDPLEARIFNALRFPFNNTIQENTASGIRGGIRTFGLDYGIGIWASTANNLITQNTGFNNDFDFVFANNMFKKYQSAVSSTVPNITQNLSYSGNT